MANVIEALFITLGLDTREYQKSQKEVGTSLKKLGETSDKQTKLIAESGKKAAGAFSALKIEILGALAAFGMGAGFKAFIESSMNGQAQLGRLSTALGMSTQSLQAWKLMAKEMGGTGEEAIGTLNKVASGLASARRGDVSFLTSANKYGAGLTLDDNVQSAMSKINRMASAIRQKYGEQQAMGVLGEMGISDFNQQQRLMETPAQFAADFAHAMSLTGAATKASTEQAAKLQKQWADLQERFHQVGERAFVKLEPVLEKLGTQLADWLDSVDWDKVIKKAGDFFDKIGQIVDALGGVKGVLIEIAAIKVFGWMASVASWVIQLRALTTALTAARAAAAAGAVTTTAGPAAAAGKGFFAKLLGGSLLLRSLWTAAWAPRPEESPEQFKARVEGLNKQFNADHPGYEQSSYWDKWKMVLGLVSSPQAKAALSASGTINRSSTDDLFSQLEKQNGLPAGLLSSIYSAESSRGKNLVSPKGALGPFQFMPGTASDYGLQGSDVFDLNKSASAAASYLHDLMKMFNGNLQDAVAAYNWGPGNVMRNGLMSMPKETSDYLQRVLGGLPRGMRSGSGAGSTTSTNTVSIGTMNVNAPKATDANGIAKSAQRAFRDNPLITGSVTALA